MIAAAPSNEMMKAPQQVCGANFHSGGPAESDGIQMTTTRVPTFTRS